jgi:hypothetical protein
LFHHHAIFSSAVLSCLNLLILDGPWVKVKLPNRGMASFQIPAILQENQGDSMIKEPCSKLQGIFDRKDF